MAGETGTGMMDSQWFQPYGTHRAMYGNAEAGPSTQPPPPIPYGVWQTAQTTGGTSETAANAETNKTFTEEDETPVSDFYCSPVPRVTDHLLGVRHLGSGAPMAKG